MAHLYDPQNAERASTSTAPTRVSRSPESMVSPITSNLKPLRGGPVTRLASRRSGAPTTQLEKETPEEKESTIRVTRSTTRQASVSTPRRLRNRHKDASQVKEQDVDPIPHSKRKAGSQIVNKSSSTTRTTAAPLAITEPAEFDTIIVQFIKKCPDVGGQTRAVMDASTPGRELFSKDSTNSDVSPQLADRGSVRSGAPTRASSPIISMDSSSRMALITHHARPTLASMAKVSARRSLPAPNPYTLQQFKPTTRLTKPGQTAPSSNHAPLPTPTDIGRTTPGIMPLKNDANPTETTFNEPTQTVQQIPSSSAAAPESRRRVRFELPPDADIPVALTPTIQQSRSSAPAAPESRRRVRFELTPKADIPVGLTPTIQPSRRSKRTLDMIEDTPKDKDRQNESGNRWNPLSSSRKRINMGAEIQIDTTLVTPVRRQRQVVKEMLPLPLKRDIPEDLCGLGYNPTSPLSVFKDPPPEREIDSRDKGMEDQYDEPSVKTLEYVESAQVRRLLDIMAELSKTYDDYCLSAVR